MISEIEDAYEKFCAEEHYAYSDGQAYFAFESGWLAALAKGAR